MVTADGSLRPGHDDRLARPVQPRSASRRHLPPGIARLLGPVLLVLLWFLATNLGWVDSRTLSSPQEVWDAAQRLRETGALQDNILVSFQRAMIGLAIGVVVGVALAVASGLSRIGENLIDANLQILRSLPILALVPLAIVWFGIGEEVKILLVAIAVMFPIYLNTNAAIRGVDQRFVDLAQTVGLGRTALIRRVILPGALPGFFTGPPVLGRDRVAGAGRQRADQRRGGHRCPDDPGPRSRPDRRDHGRPRRLRRVRAGLRHHRPLRGEEGPDMAIDTSVPVTPGSIETNPRSARRSGGRPLSRLRRPRDPARHRPRDPAGRVRRPARTLRLGQEHAAADPGAPRCRVRRHAASARATGGRVPGLPAAAVEQGRSTT